MARYFITGFSGFVSGYFLEYLEKADERSKVLGIDHIYPDYGTNYKNIDVVFEKTDLLNSDKVKALLINFQPDYVIHLASLSSVSYSWKNPAKSFINNTNIFLNLLEIIRLNNISCRLLSIGSSEEYGNVVAEDLPLRETKELVPISPYAVARVSQEMLSKIYHKGYGLDIVITRSFNHIGPRQKDIFVVSSFAKQIINIKNSGKDKGILTCGDVDIIRDFLDVRDVVKAYHLLLGKGKKGEVYNVCSSNGYTLKDIIEKMGKITELNIEIRRDKNLVRVLDNRMIVGNNEKLKKDTGWNNNIDIDESLTDILDYWNTKIHEDSKVAL